jgi:hypothetical protein
MKNKEAKKKIPPVPDAGEVNKELPGYSSYPEKEDIYYNLKEEKDIDPDDISQIKTSGRVIISGKSKKKDIPEDETGDGLDVPGSELDDDEENIGNEDEENNYYSLGSDDHDDLDEDKG